MGHGISLYCVKNANRRFGCSYFFFKASKNSILNIDFIQFFLDIYTEFSRSNCKRRFRNV